MHGRVQREERHLERARGPHLELLHALVLLPGLRRPRLRRGQVEQEADGNDEEAPERAEEGDEEGGGDVDCDESDEGEDEGLDEGELEGSETDGDEAILEDSVWL